MQNNKKTFEAMVSKTKIYLAIIAILLVVLCIQNIYFIIPSIVVYSLIILYTFWTNNKRKNEISKHLQELTITVDSAAKNTLINSPFPLVIIENDGNIVWRSPKFVTEFKNVDINNILSQLLKDLRVELVDDKNKKERTLQKEIKIGKHTYEILGEYIKTKQRDRKKTVEYMMTLYFIDSTKRVEAIKELNDSKTCIGIIKVDNYEEIMQRIPNEDKPQILAQIEKNIYEWANVTNGVVIKQERDTFVYVFEQKYLKDIKDNKFDILDIVKEIEIEMGMQITLSIAISTEGNSNYDRYKSALAAMDIVLGRGGDQAVIREDEKYNFFGGRAQEVEKRTKVKARIMAHALVELMKETNDILIMGHTNGDIDSIGSSLGIYRLAKTLGKEAFIVNNTFGLSLENFIEAINKEDGYEDVLIDRNQSINKITQNTLLIVVDTHKRNYVEVPELLEKTNKIVVIDHHRRSTDYIDDATLMFHEVYASSAAELVTELLQYSENTIELTQIEAEALYGGIMVDTKNFTFKTGVRTFEAAAYLRKMRCRYFESEKMVSK